jgi:hypothetical protein
VGFAPRRDCSERTFSEASRTACCIPAVEIEGEVSFEGGLRVVNVSLMD